MAEEKKGEAKSGGTDEKTLALVAYVLTWLTGLIVFLMSKDKGMKVARFHAMQSIILGIIGTLCGITILLSPISLILWLYGLYVGFTYGYKGEIYKIPYIGEYAEKYAEQ